MFVAPDHDVQVSRPPSLNTNAVIVVGTMRHRGVQVSKDQIIPCGDGQRFLLRSTYISLNQIWQAIVHTDNNSLRWACMLQMQTQMAWWVSGEVDVVPQANVPQGMETLKPHHGRGPVHCRSSKDVHGATLRPISIVDLHRNWSPSPYHVVPIHHLDQQVAVLSLWAFVRAPIRIENAHWPVDAWYCVHWANCCWNLRRIEVCAKCVGIYTTIAACVLRLWLGTVRWVHCLLTLASVYRAKGIIPAMVQWIQEDMTSILADSNDLLSLLNCLIVVWHPHSCHGPAALHVEDHATLILLTLIFETSSRAMCNTGGEWNRITHCIVASRHWDEVFHCVKAHWINILQLVVKSVWR
mmetsp:Transcript_88032/g.161431  ORF Transcript_88032/g.161431 Transcript_88032/m.161431 type:complete len:353 (-) Transcript_88032:5002-6060(-)